MLHSMTGYGRAERELDGQRWSVELRSVNHRALDLKVSLPSTLAPLEVSVMRWCRPQLGRGRVDVKINASGAGRSGVELDATLIERSFEQLSMISQRLGLEPPTLGDLMQLPGAWRTPRESVDVDATWPLIEDLLGRALAALNESRAREGEALLALLFGQLERYSGHLEQARKVAPTRVEGYRARLRERIAQLSASEDGLLDPQRLATEIALFADRVDVTEEIDRATTHLKAIDALLRTPRGPEKRVGKRLDFFLQELNRESNTLASKARDATLTQHAVEMKTLVESMREQAANIQ